MQYKAWLEKHQHKLQKILVKLDDKNLDEVISYFEYENMQTHESDFCPLYAQNIKCHDTEKLNCYFCACPHFVFDDKGLERAGQKIRYSRCAIKSKEGREYIHDNAIHQDCTYCTLPHTKAYINKQLRVSKPQILLIAFNVAVF